MAEVETMVAALRRTADRGDGRGIRFYANPSAAEHRTYADLDRAARSDAALLAEAGHRRGDVAVLAFDPGLDFIRSVFAAFYAGMAIAPVPIAVGRDPRGTSDRLLAVVRDSGSRLILTGGQALDPVLDAGPGLSDHADVRHLGVEADVDRADAWQPPAIDGDSLAILQYTSGSTGRPKGVIITHGNLVANQRAITAATRTHSEDSLVGWLPHYHDMGLIGALLNPVYQGHELTLTTPAQFLRRPVFWLRLITDHRATLTVGPDFAYNLCSRLVTDEQLAQLDLSSLRRVITGAEPVRAATLAAFADRFAAAGFRASAFNPAYGMAETTLLVTAHVTDNAVQPHSLDAAALEAGRVVPAAHGRAVEAVPCGPAAPGHKLVIVDPESGIRSAPDRIGEIWVSGPSVSRGYWGKPEATAEVFGAQLPGEADEYLRTGDLGALIDGELVITGRIKDLIIVRGRNIYPQDLEFTASAVNSAGTGSALSAAFGVDDDQEITLVAEVDPAVQEDEHLRSAAAGIRQAVLAAHDLPAVRVVLIRRGTLPRTTSGKVQRALTRSLLGAGTIPILYTT